MGRIRTIKPEFWIHEELSALTAETHLLAAGLLNYADDYGFFNPHPALVKAAVFPLRETAVLVPLMMEQLAAIGYIRIGTTKSGRKVGEVINFLSHQRVSHPTKSRYKDEEVEWEPSRKIPEDSVKAPETFRPEGKGKEGNGKELKSSRDKRGDERHVPFRNVLEAAWKAKSQLEMPWDAGEAKQLASLLAANPTLTEEAFRELLRNRHKSQVNHSERPRQWIARLTDYGNGPLDQFGKPLGAGNGTFKGKTESTVDAAQRVIEAIENRNASGSFGYPQTGETGRPGLPSLCE